MAASATVNGVQLHYEFTGSGSVPLVLVHGSWDSHHDWDLVVPRLGRHFQVLAYDRRGHSQSARPEGPGSVDEDVADLAGLIARLGLAPAIIVGNSFGASISLRMTREHRTLVRGIIAHEPPLFALLADDPGLAPLLNDVSARIRLVIDRIASGDYAGAAEQFVDTVALGPGSWAQIPREYQQTIIGNAPTFLDESRDPHQLAFDLNWLTGFSKPVLLTMGDRSPPMFAPVIGKLAPRLPQAEVVTLEGAGHVPHLTHPDAYVDLVLAFASRHFL